MRKKLNKILGYCFQVILWFIIIDVIIFRFCFHIGFPTHYEKGDYYIEAPYAMYVSKDISKSYLYNREYNKEESIFNDLHENDIKVAFFAGSTGILGEPKLTKLIEKELSEKLKRNVFVGNFSILSGTSRQHMHMLLEYFKDFKPDIVIFYNGFNEIVVPFGEDPRPGYPYNQFYIEIPEWKKCLIKYSAIFGLIEEHYEIITQRNKLRNQIGYMSADWYDNIVFNYFDTLDKAKIITENTIKSRYFGKPIFVTFFQPFIENRDGYDIYGRNSEVENLTKEIRNKIPNYNYIYDLHEEYNQFNKEEIYDDVCHVHGKAHVAMAKKIADLVYEELKQRKLLNKI